MIFFQRYRWRRIISLTVLVTFSGSLFSPAFASNTSVNNGATANSTNVMDDDHRYEFNTKLAPTSKTNNKSKTTLNKTNYHAVGKNGYFNVSTNHNQSKHKLFSPSNKYQPYLELGGAKYFNQASSTAGIYDLFIPLLQKDNQLLFADLRIFDRSGSSSEGNLHLGYRKLYSNTKQVFGIYGAFDCKRSNEKNSFKQLTLGIEYWNNKLFIGGNIYKPIGETKKFIGTTNTQELMPISRNIVELKTTSNEHYEKALSGLDAELGYAITENITSYVGSYYFTASDANAIVGPKVRITYDYLKPNGRILGILDGISIEAGAQHDKSRGNTAYVGLKLKVGLTNFEKNSNIVGFERHMIDLVKRDPDVVTAKVNKTNQRFEKFYQDGQYGFQEGNKQYTESKEFTQWTTEELLREFGISKGTTDEETAKNVRKKYRELVLIHHPDKGGKAEEFIRDTAIYEILKERLGSISSSNIPAYQNESYSYNHRSSCYDMNNNENKDIETRNNNIIQLISSGVSFSNDYKYRGDGVVIQNSESKERESVLTNNKNALSLMEKIKKLNNVNTKYTNQVNDNLYDHGKTTLDEIKRMDYQYTDFDIKMILTYRMLEIINVLKEDEKSKRIDLKNLQNIRIVNPISKKELELITNQFKEEFEIPEKKLLIPIYLDDKSHWVGAIVENKNNFLEIKYFDSYPIVKYVEVSHAWLTELAGKIYHRKIKNISSNDILQQSKNSVGCGAFTIENSIRVLGIIDDDISFLKKKYDENTIRGRHYELLKKHKNSIVVAINTLKKHGINFIDINSILHPGGARIISFRGGGRKEEEIEGNAEEELGNKKDYPLFQKNYNVVYQLISDYEYLLIPMSGAIAGGIKWGPWGIVIGGALGLVDEAFIYFGYMEKHYLSCGIFGATAGHIIKPLRVIVLAGAVVGLLLPTGILNDHQELIVPTVSTLAGYSFSGFQGLIKGGLTGVVDEMLIYIGITNKHYLTFCHVGIAVVNSTGWLHGLILINSVGFALGLIVANYEEKIIIVWSPIKLNKDLYKVYSMVLPKRQLESHIERQLLTLIGIQFAIQYMTFQISECEQSYSYSFERFDTPNNLIWRNFQTHIIRLIVLFSHIRSGKSSLLLLIVIFLQNFISPYMMNCFLSGLL